MRHVPPPQGDPAAPPRALIFDSVFDQYRGVIAYVRVVDGTFRRGEAIRAMQTGTRADIDDIGFRSPDMVKTETLEAGEVGYIITGIKNVAKLRVGDTLTTEARPATEALPGYKEARPVVFCGLYPVDTDQYADLRDALEKLSLNDASLSYEPETSQALGFGFRCGFLGLLHMDIVRERLEREYDLDLLATTPNVEYHVRMSERRDARGPLPAGHARPELHRGGRGALHPREHHHAARLHREHHGAVPGAPRHAHRHALPVRAAGADALRPAAGRDRARLLRPAQVTQPGLCVPRLRADRLPRIRPREARHHARRATSSTRSRWSSTRTRRTTRARPWSSASRRRSRASSTRSRSRPRSARASSPARR